MPMTKPGKPPLNPKGISKADFKEMEKIFKKGKGPGIIMVMGNDGLLYTSFNAELNEVSTLLGNIDIHKDVIINLYKNELAKMNENKKDLLI